MKRLPLLAVALGLLLSSGFAAEEKAADAKKGAKKDKLAGIKCPVSGAAVKKDKTLAFKGKTKLYFCCGNCPKAFKKNRKKYMVKANHQLAATGQAKQVKCPMTGKACAKDKVVEMSGVKVAFCCGGCVGKAKKATGDAQLSLAFSNKAFKKGFKYPKKKKSESKGLKGLKGLKKKDKN